MRRKKKEETLDDTLKEMAEALKEHGENNLAIVLYTYLGSRKAGLDGYFAKHCQEFAKKGSENIKKHLKRGTN
jgi:hypothetical protein